MFPMTCAQPPCANIDVRTFAGHEYPTPSHVSSTSHGMNPSRYTESSKSGTWYRSHTAEFAAISPTVTKGKRRVGMLSLSGSTRAQQYLPATWTDVRETRDRNPRFGDSGHAD